MAYTYGETGRPEQEKTAKARPLILVADDEPKCASLLERILSSEGYNVLYAPDGQEALTMAKSNRVDLVLLDVMMPRLNGYEVIERLRANTSTRCLPVMLITGLHAPDERVKGKALGCDDFICKPFNVQEILVRVKSLLQAGFYRSFSDTRETFEFTIDHVDCGVMVLDAARKPVRVNRRCREWFSLKSNAASGPFPMLLGPEFRVRYDGDLAVDILRAPVCFDLERNRSAAHTTSLILDVCSNVIFDPLGEASSIVLTIRDVTRERQNVTSQEAFLTLATHKLLTPLSVIQATLSNLLDGTEGSLSGEQKTCIAICTERAHEFQQMLHKLMEFTVLGKARKDACPEGVRLCDYLGPFIKRQQDRWRHRPVHFEINCPDDLTCPVEEAHLELILGNLVENGVRFCSKEFARVSITARAHEGGIEIMVRDNGIGISPEEREKIFQAFDQVDEYATGGTDGFGLGLTIVRYLVTLYQGEVYVRSQLGLGSTVGVKLPAFSPLI